MYAEELKQKPVGALAGLLITLACVGIVFVCWFWVSFLQYWLQIVWLQFVFYGLVGVAVLFAIQRYFTEYIYLIERDRITFGRRIGRREKELLFVPLRDVICIIPYNKEREKKEDKKVFRFTFRKKNTWSMIVCKGCVIIVTCTSEYEKCLRARIKGEPPWNANKDAA